MNLYELLAEWNVSEEEVDLLLAHGVASDTIELFLSDEDYGSYKLEIGLADDGITVLGHRAYETEF